MFMLMLMPMIILMANALGPVRNVLAGEQVLPGRHATERPEPPFVVGRDFTVVLCRRDFFCQRLAEQLPLERPLLVQGDGQAKNPGLPWRLENQLAILPRQRDLFWQFLVQTPASPTPIIESRVTIFASSSSLSPSVPAGRFGNTI